MIKVRVAMSTPEEINSAGTYYMTSLKECRSLGSIQIQELLCTTRTESWTSLDPE